jgi:surface polysaccharide O-acyltransferase-like enzyme
MKDRTEVIDYLRAISILAIVLIHIILPTIYNLPTIYSSNNFLFVLWKFLNLSVVSLIICSGFALYVSYPKLKTRKKDIY